MSEVMHCYTRVSALVAGFLVALAGRAPAQTNTWIQLSPTPTTQWLPVTSYDCQGTQVRNSPAGRAYSGSAMGGGQIFYWGGGHASYPGNDVILYDVGSNQWIPDPTQPQCLAPCCASGADQKCDNYPVDCAGTPPSCYTGSCVISGGTGDQKAVFRCSGGSRDQLVCSQDSDCAGGGTCSIGIPTPGVVCTTCRPYTYHTYQQAAYNPSRGTFLLAANGNSGYGSGTWEWNPASRGWSMLQTPPPVSNLDQEARGLFWDDAPANVTRGQTMILMHAGSGTSGEYSFNYGSNTWTHYDSYMPTGNTWMRPYAAWDAHAQKFVVSLLSNADTSVVWYTYDPTITGAAAWRGLLPPTDLTSFCTSTATTSCYSFAVTYDATNQRTIVLAQDPGSGLALWAYDGVGNTWQKVTTRNTASATDCNTGYPNHLHYGSTTGSVYLFDTSPNSGWRGGGAPATKLWKIQLDLGNPLPTNTLANTSTVTPTRPTATPTNTRPTATPTNTQPTATPTMTPTVGPTTPTPTCATVRLVGPGRTYTKPSQAAAVVQTNDCVYIDAGNYPNDVALWPASASNLTIRGVNGMAKLTITNGLVYGSKAIWVVDGTNTTIENVEFSCATSRTNNPNCSGILVGDGNDAGIRLEAPGLTVRNCIFRDNDDGILGGPNISGTSGNVLIEKSEFYRNGFGDGFTHNLYLNDHNTSLTFRYNYTHGAITGHNLKSRASTNYILYNRITDETNGVTDCTDPGKCSASNEIELPCGGLAYIIGNVMEKGPNADAKQIVKFAAELSSPSCPQPSLTTQELYVINNTMANDYGATTQFIQGAGTAPLLWSKNNIFWGAGQSISWPSGGTIVEASDVTANPQLLSQSTFDYHLTADSTVAINAGVDPGTDSHGYHLMPTQQYLYDRQYMARPSDGSLDVGAFEYIAEATPFPTPTNSPTSIATPSPIWTATPTAPTYCLPGQMEAVYSVAVSGDDGLVQFSGTTYSALTPSILATNGYNDYSDAAARTLTNNGTYKVSLVAWRWNTGLRPDGTPWPFGTKVVGAFLRPYWVKPTSNGTRSLIFEWHSWPPPTPLSNADWTLTSPVNSAPTFAATTAQPTTNARQTIALSNGDVNVNLAAYTGLRLMVSDTTPPAAGEENTVAVRAQDYQSAAGDWSTQLVVCYVLGPVSPPPPPHLL